MRPIQIRLSDEDREQYGGDEWLPLHAALFVKVRSNRLEAWEEQLGGLKLLDLLNGDVDVKSIKYPRQLAWLARQVAGLTEPRYDAFETCTLDMQIQALDLQPEGDDVDPPASSSAETSAETVMPSRSRRGSRS